MFDEGLRIQNSGLNVCGSQSMVWGSGSGCQILRHDFVSSHRLIDSGLMVVQSLKVAGLVKRSEFLVRVSRNESGFRESGFRARISGIGQGFRNRTLRVQSGPLARLDPTAAPVAPPVSSPFPRFGIRSLRFGFSNFVLGVEGSRFWVRV